MAAIGSDEIVVLVGGRDISGDVIDWSAGQSTVAEESHGMGDAWVEQTAVGVSRGEAQINGIYNDAGSDPAFIGQEGTSRVLGFQLGTAQGDTVLCFAGAMEANSARSSARESLMKISTNIQSSGVVEDADVIQPHAADSGAGATPAGSLDNAASSANGAALYLFISALTLGGYTSVTVTVEDSPDNSAWATLGTFTAVTSAPTAERITVSGTVDRYTRATLTWNGAGSSESVTLLVGIARG